MIKDIHGIRRGRNDPCWCGSGLKYKLCHLGRSDQAPLETSEVLKRFYKASELRNCSCPPSLKHECSGQIVRAHSLSKRRALAAVTESGHVFSPIPDPEKFLRRDDPRGKVMGINKASTFTGFCGKHDQEFFRELDTEEFDGKASKTFLAAYRTLCREHFAKVGHLKTFEIMRDLDKGRSKSEQIFIQNTSSYGALGARTALGELRNLKARFDRALLTADYNEFAFKNFRFDVSTDLVSAGGFNPTHDLSGTLIQDLVRLDRQSESIFLSILPSVSGFWVSFLWPAECGLMKAFVDDFDRQATVGVSLALAFAFVENTFLKPSTWQGFSRSEKFLITRLSLMGTVDDDYSALPAAVRFLTTKFPHKPIEILGNSSQLTRNSD